MWRGVCRGFRPCRSGRITQHPEVGLFRLKLPRNALLVAVTPASVRPQKTVAARADLAGLKSPDFLQPRFRPA